MKNRNWISATLLLLTVVGAGVLLSAWKSASNKEREAAAANQPEPMEAVTVATAMERAYRDTSTSIGTILALRSIALRNELAGTVREVKLEPGATAEAGDVLVALDVSVEEAELKALQAQATLAATNLERMRRLVRNRAAPEAEVERAVAERDVALAHIERTKAIIARKTIRAPFRSRVGLADVHPGQFLESGTELTTLQGIDDDAYVDFNVAQHLAAGLRHGDVVEIVTASSAQPIEARIVALDARIDPLTRNAAARARIIDAAAAPRPGASVRVRVPAGPMHAAVAIPASALRRGPAGDEVFVIAEGADGRPRAFTRAVRSGPGNGEVALIESGLEPGEQVAASGSFKLRESALVAIVNEAGATASASAAR